MFGDYVFEKTSAQYISKLLLVDVDDFEEKMQNKNKKLTLSYNKTII